MKSLVKSGMMFLAGILILATSCNQVDESEGGKGRVVLKLTDAPFPVSLVEEAWVTIDKIEIRSTGTVSATTETSEEEADLESQFTVLYEGEGKEFDLLDLQNGVTAEILTAELEAGSYDMIRMHVSGAEIVLKTGTTFDLKVPGGNASGLKIKISPELVIESGVESEVLLDFDVSKSFVAQGNMHSPQGIKGFIFKPVLRAMCQKYSGSIEGLVSENATTSVAGAHVQIFRADTVYSSAITDNLGAYALVGLPAGSYKLTCEKEGYTALEVNPVVVKAREKTIVDLTLVKVLP